MRKLAGSARAELLSEGRIRLVLRSSTGEEVGMDLSPDDAQAFAASIPVNPPKAAAPQGKSGSKNRKN